MNKICYLTSEEYLQLFTKVFNNYGLKCGWDSRTLWHPEDMEMQASVVHDIMFATLNELSAIRNPQ